MSVGDNVQLKYRQDSSYLPAPASEFHSLWKHNGRGGFQPHCFGFFAPCLSLHVSSKPFTDLLEVVAAHKWTWVRPPRCPNTRHGRLTGETRMAIVDVVGTVAGS